MVRTGWGDEGGVTRASTENLYSSYENIVPKRGIREIVPLRSIKDVVPGKDLPPFRLSPKSLSTKYYVCFKCLNVYIS